MNISYHVPDIIRTNLDMKTLLCPLDHLYSMVNMNSRFGIILGVLIFSSLSPTILQNSSNIQFNSTILEINVKCQAISPVFIDGNTDLDTYCSETDGLSPETAHLIENSIIDASEMGDCFLIQNTSRFLIIRNCTFLNAQNDAPYAGLRLINCTNIKIEECVVNSDSGIFQGISLWNSNNNNVVVNNTIINAHVGIYCSESSNNMFADNIIKNGYIGVDINFSDSTTWTNNTCSDLSERGFIIHASNNNLFKSNFCTRNLDSGMYLSFSSENTLVENTCTYNSLSGIVLFYSTSNTLAQNIFSQNSGNGTSITQFSNDNDLRDNNYTDNTHYGISLSSVHSNSLVNNTYDSNLEYGLYIDHLSNLTSVIDPLFINNNGGSTNAQFLDEGMNNRIWFTSFSETVSFNGNSQLEDSYMVGDGLTQETAFIFEGVTIDAGGVGDCLFIANTDRFLIIRNCRMLNGQNYAQFAGIRLINSSNVKIELNVVFSPSNGISLDNSHNNSLIDNNCDWPDVLTDRDWITLGISLESSHNNELTNNTCTIYRIGISLDNSHNNLIRENNMSGKITRKCISLYASHNTIVKDNTCQGKYGDHWGIYIESAHNTTLIHNFIDIEGGYGTMLAGIILRSSTNTTILNNIISLVDCVPGIAIFLLESNNTYVENNILTGSDYLNSLEGVGIAISNLYSIYVKNNIIDDFGTLIAVSRTSNSTIENNILKNYYFNGIDCRHSSNISAINNICTSKQRTWYSRGIHLEATDGGNLIGNSVINNEYGLSLKDTHKITIINNTCENNEFGIYFQNSSVNMLKNNTCAKNSNYGIYLDLESNYNVLTGTTFILNYNGTEKTQFLDEGSGNIWEGTFFILNPVNDTNTTTTTSTSSDTSNTTDTTDTSSEPFSITGFSAGFTLCFCIGIIMVISRKIHNLR